MNIFKWFYKYKKRDVISFEKIKTGTILKVYPEIRSQSIIPYKVVVAYSSEDCFCTCLIGGGIIRTFRYNSPEWKEYHCNRFKIIKL